MIKKTFAKGREHEFVADLPFSSNREMSRCRKQFKLDNFPERSVNADCDEFYLQYLDGITDTDFLKPNRVATEKSMIKKYGEIEGKAKWKEKKRKDSIKGTLERYIERFGEIEGTIKYEEKNKKLSVSVESLKLSGKTDEEIKKIRLRHSDGSKITLEHMMSRYGEVEGNKKYNQWLNTSRERSVWCVEYYTKRGYNIQDAEKEISKLQTKDLNYFIKKYGKECGRKRYLECNRLKATSLEILVEKYGEDEGRERWFSYKNNHNKNSIVETEFFDELIPLLKPNYKIYYGDNQYKIGLFKKDWVKYEKKVFFLDFLLKDKKKIIEFNGDIWHGNPGLYESGDRPHPFNDLTRQELNEIDNNRYEYLKSIGYEVLVIWENDVVNNREKELNKCIAYLEN